MNPITVIWSIFKFANWIRKHIPHDVREAALNAVKEASIVKSVGTNEERREWAVQRIIKLTHTSEHKARAAVEMAVGIYKAAR